MATFSTPEPISLVIDISTGDIRITASDRADTVVDVRPTDSSNAADVKAAEQARIDYARGKLVVKAPTQAGPPSRWSRRGGSVEVTVELPEGSNVRGASAWAALRCDGRLGEVRFDTVHSDITLDETGSLRLSAMRAQIAVAKVDGPAVIKNDQGDTTIGEVTGNVRTSGTNGNFHVERAHGSLDGKTAHGNVRIDEVARGIVKFASASGDIEIGIRAGTAAKFDVGTVSGRIRNSLETVDGPTESDEIVEVRAQTFSGDVVIRRS